MPAKIDKNKDYAEVSAHNRSGYYESTLLACLLSKNMQARESGNHFRGCQKLLQPGSNEESQCCALPFNYSISSNYTRPAEVSLRLIAMVLAGAMISRADWNTVEANHQK